ncbi:hypothetical protein NGM10_08980 [Halorussus salilacus]|uniref:hypothetical protein n=1 Tax=Halorussus salilacus TaxID=2953750 RepID=UPI00209FC07E|nr:hypothetical protein [Halorussus salilacus]USZ66864.1 hypothetical protein NGM10_08980 [Halorussus salilacus]
MAQTTAETIVGEETVRNTWTSAVLGGVSGGLAFGVLLQTMGMMPAIASLYGAESAAVGWVAHLFHSVMFGLVFAAVVVRTDYRDADLRTTAVLGAGYGVALWAVAAAVVMPLWMGAMGLDAPAIPNLDVASLAGHLVYGLVLGAVFVTLRRR